MDGLPASHFSTTIQPAMKAKKPTRSNGVFAFEYLPTLPPAQSLKHTLNWIAGYRLIDHDTPAAA